MDPQELIARIPFEVSSAHIIDRGWANIVIEADGKWIFRFSRTAVTSAQMRLECAFLPEFERRSPVHVPRLAVHGPAFMGYEKLVGAPLTRDFREQLAEAQQARLSRDLGSFLTSLHSVAFAHPDLQEFPYGGELFWEQSEPRSVGRTHC